MEPRGGSKPQGTKRSVALGQGPDSQVEGFQMPHDLATCCCQEDLQYLEEATPWQLAGETHWLELKIALRWQDRFLLILTNSHYFWMADSPGEPSWAAVFPE